MTQAEFQQKQLFAFFALEFQKNLHESLLESFRGQDIYFSETISDTLTPIIPLNLGGNGKMGIETFKIRVEKSPRGDFLQSYEFNNTQKNKTLSVNKNPFQPLHCKFSLWVKSTN